MSSAKQEKRRRKLMPNDIPRWVRIYDNEGCSADQFTCVYTGLYNNLYDGPSQHYYRTMSRNPSHPQGVGIFCQSDRILDHVENRWGGAKIGCHHPNHNLGKRICFEDLPEECQEVVLSDYMAIWDLDEPDGY